MKKIIAILFTMLTVSAANATSIQVFDFANYEFGHLQSEKVYDINATFSGFNRFSVTAKSGNDDMVIVQNLINESTNTYLMSLVRDLSNTEIYEQFNQVVCMMMPGPAQSVDTLSVLRGYDPQQSTFWGELEPVLGPQGCWVSHSIYPENQAMVGVAKQLKAALKALALEAIAGKLK